LFFYSVTRVFACPVILLQTRLWVPAASAGLKFHCKFHWGSTLAHSQTDGSFTAQQQATPAASPRAPPHPAPSPHALASSDVPRARRACRSELPWSFGGGRLRGVRLRLRLTRDLAQTSRRSFARSPEAPLPKLTGFVRSSAKDIFGGERHCACSSPEYSAKAVGQ